MSALRKELHYSERSGGRAARLVGESMTRQDRWAVGHFAGCRLTGALQPIYCLSHKRPVGYEGLIRPTNATGRSFSPGELFGKAGNPEQLIHLDRLCRAVHIHNFVTLGLESGWLFLNLNPNLFWTFKRSRVAFTLDLMHHFGLDPSRVVLEILEKSIPDEELMGELVDQYHAMGCLVAIDDFGSGQANFDRIWRLRPDIVKLDRSIIANALHNAHARRIIPGLVSLLHQAGAMVLIEGIETQDEAMIAWDAEADFVQGFLFGVPVTNLETIPALTGETVKKMTKSFRHHLVEEGQRQFGEIRRYLDILEAWVGRVASLDELRLKGGEMVAVAGVKRCFILNQWGIQVGPNISGEKSPHFAHIAGGEGADWSRRTYYRRAVGRPGAIQVVGPYFSQPDAAMCITLSIALEIRGGGTWIFCADVEWNGPADMVVGENRCFLREYARPCNGMSA
ncbi:MAG: EAL domain-containing protein [Magnetococcales bacterium]|nr:EAL domain-containing protein [Magnetococcales bacterium]